MTTTLTPSGKVPTGERPVRRVAVASFVGTALESYDFYVYAYFAAFFVGPLFFEPLGGFGATLTAFLTIAIAFVVRPIGAIIFGHIGDRLGRRTTLLITITMMGVATGLIGVLPPYAMSGWVGAILLVSLRVAQGLSLGGEWGGSILLATEHAGPARRAFYAAVPQLGSPVGSILSAVLFIGLTTSLSSEAMLEWGWRIPFLTAIPLLLISLYLRWSISETPVFRELVVEDRRDKLPFVSMITRAPLALIVAVGAALLGIGSYALMNTYTIDYGVTQLGFSYPELLLATTIGGLLQLITIPLFGAWAQRIGSARVVIGGALGTLLIAFPMYYVLQFATFPILVATMIVGGILPTMAWASLGGLMSDLFPDHFRYSALSFAYSIAAMITGFVPALTLAFGESTDFAWWHPGIILAVMSALTLAAALGARRMATPPPSADAVPTSSVSTPR